MTVQLGTKTLNCTNITVQSRPQATEWDAFENEEWTIKRKVWGLKRVWRLDCYEKDVTWSNSAAKYLREQAEAGNTLTLSIDEGDRYNTSATVHVLSVDLRIGITGTQNIRQFSVLVREA